MAPAWRDPARRARRLTLDDVEIRLPSGLTCGGPEVANLLRHGGPLQLARRLFDLAQGAEPPLQAALLDLAHRLEPGPIPEVLAARCPIEINRQPDHWAPADDDPGPGVWGPDMLDYVHERWLRRQLDGLSEAK